MSNKSDAVLFRKTKLERNIELCIIDTSKMAYFKEKNAKPYLDIICNIINIKYL
jgi:hypothetical protein